MAFFSQISEHLCTRVDKQYRQLAIEVIQEVLGEEIRKDFEELHRLNSIYHESEGNHLMQAFIGSKLMKFKTEKRAYDKEESIYSDAIKYMNAMRKLIEIFGFSEIYAGMVTEDSFVMMNRAMKLILLLR